MSVSKKISPRTPQDGPEATGPYSPGPRRPQKRPVRKYLATGSTAVVAAAFVHCVMPLI